jgi:hypothetical protein
MTTDAELAENIRSAVQHYNITVAHIAATIGEARGRVSAALSAASGAGIEFRGSIDMGMIDDATVYLRPMTAPDLCRRVTVS